MHAMQSAALDTGSLLTDLSCFSSNFASPRLNSQPLYSVLGRRFALIWLNGWIFISSSAADRIMSTIAVEYYNRKFGDDRSAAFIHLVREIGEIAFAMEKNNVEHAKMEITESAALLYYLATKYCLDLDDNMKAVYTKKLDMLTTKS